MPRSRPTPPEVERFPRLDPTPPVEESSAAVPVVIAAGTRDDVSSKARAALVLAAESTRAEELSSLVHDLKNPLSNILLESSLLEKRLGGRATPAVRQGLERIARNAAYIDRLASDLLDVSAASAGRLELRLERLDLVHLLRDALARIVPTQARMRVQLEIRAVLFVAADALRLERVLANLVDNALKYGGAGTPVTIRLDARGAYARVAVIDRGPGLAAEESRRIFERYRRAATAHARPGYGIGLHACRRIIQAHRGRIGVESAVGRGSRFFFELLAIAPHHMRELA